MKRILIFVFSIIFAFNSIYSQDQKEPNYDEFINHFKKEYFTIEMLLQSVADFQIERTFPGNNSFYLSNVRLKIYGQLDNGFGYFFQTNFLISPFLLDAFIRYKFSENLILDAGQFKAPFSKEFLFYAANIDFVNRSQSSFFLSPRRQIGFQLSGTFIDKLFEYKAGVFNGNGPNKIFNENNSFMYVGRIAAKPTTLNSSYEIGINAGYSEDKNVGILGRDFTGKKTMLGGDIRAEIGKVLLSSEFNINMLKGEIDSTTADRKPYGFHITGGYMISPKHQILFRYDNLSPDAVINNSNLYIIGYNYWPTKATELQVNYTIDADQPAIKFNWLLINLQVSL